MLPGIVRVDGRVLLKELWFERVCIFEMVHQEWCRPEEYESNLQSISNNNDVMVFIQSQKEHVYHKIRRNMGDKARLSTADYDRQ